MNIQIIQYIVRGKKLASTTSEVSLNFMSLVHYIVIFKRRNKKCRHIKMLIKKIIYNVYEENYRRRLNVLYIK